MVVNFEKRFMSRMEDLATDLFDMVEDGKLEKLHGLGKFGWLLTAGRHYPDDGFLNENDISLLAEGERIWAQSLVVEDEKLAFIRSWIDASQAERDLGLGIYCCIRLMVGDFHSDDEALVLFRVASERYAFAIACPPLVDSEIAAHDISRNPAAEMAKLRHAESRTLIKEALEHWKEHIDPTLSAQKAATELIKIVPLSHKKLAQIISAEKKKIS